ncbi:MAG: L-dopachrome tautomerase-related protein [Planctomycetota bacterium]
MRRYRFESTALCLLVISGAGRPALADLPRAECAGDLEAVTTFHGPMPTGVTVSRSGRIFVNFPRWGDQVDFTVAELKRGQPQPYPDARTNQLDEARGANCFVSVQSVVIDPNDRLWVLDTGRPEHHKPRPGGPKLVGIDLNTNTIFKKILFPSDVARPTTYLNDVRFDLRRGAEGMAFITDSSTEGPNALIVVDLASGRSRRRLEDHPSTKADPEFQPIVEGRPLMIRIPGQPPRPFPVGADGIAITPDGKRLYYCPLSSRALYSVDVDALVDEQTADEDVARTITAHPPRGFASDGLESDGQGRIYLTDYEDNGVLRLTSDGQYETIVYYSRALWPDSLCVAPDGCLYLIANQLHRQAQFQNGLDRRVKPYVLFRTRLNWAGGRDGRAPVAGDRQAGATRPAGQSEAPDGDSGGC